MTVAARALGRAVAPAALALVAAAGGARAQEAAALWLFDGPVGLYPSSVIDDAAPGDRPMVLGLGGEIVEGRFGNALEIRAEPRDVEELRLNEEDFGRREGEGDYRFGLDPAPIPAGRTVQPLWWGNADYAALMTVGEGHLRSEVGFANATDTPLNLGDFDWTVEAWYRPGRASAEDGVLLEVGAGPRGENDVVTRLSLAADRSAFTLTNAPSGAAVAIPTDAAALDPAAGGWHHLAFAYDAAAGRLRHWVDGRLQPLPEPARLEALPHGEEAYLTVGRDGTWGRPLPGALDEMRISTGLAYEGEAFDPPGSFAPVPPETTLAQGPPLLFAGETEGPIALAGRKHVFVDDALVERAEGVEWVPNPPRKAELVIADIQGPFRKHLSVVEGDDGLVRIYNGVEDDRLEVHVAADGVHFEDRDTGIEYRGSRNIAVPEATATGTVFVDPNAAPDRRWTFVTGYHDRGTYVYTSPDGWSFERWPTAAIPMKVGSQSNAFWDDQRGTYVGYHRSDCRAFPSGETRREWVMTETKRLLGPWPFEPSTAAELRAESERRLLRRPQPWFMDNGPLTPGGACVEYPTAFAPIDSLDPLAVDVYVPKAVKYPWAEDTYLAFPTMYFHYWEDGPPTRRALGDPERGLGSGPIESQISVSRDAVHWKRYPRPVYVGIGDHAGYNVVQAYMAEGMVRRGDEIWQYYYGTEEYHSTLQAGEPRRGVFRVVQRLDGFVSVDAPYDTVGTLVTKPLTFEGDRLTLNVDTNATGYLQVGFLDAAGEPIPGFSVDESVYVNGDFIEKDAEWMEKGTDVSALEGKVVRLVFRMRGSKLYALRFRGEE